MMAKPQVLASVLKNMNPVPETAGTNYVGGRAFKRGDLAPEQLNANLDAHKAMGVIKPFPPAIPKEPKVPKFSASLTKGKI